MDNDNENQNLVQNDNNMQRFNNPFNLDPNKQDILIERRLERDFFCPISAFHAEFGIRNAYYSIILNQPLKESFFHAVQSLLFPNATFFQISIILCYISIIIFIVLLCFGLDETNLKNPLPVKLSTLDKFGYFNSKKIKENPWELYRLLTFHFYHFNLSHLLFNIFILISFCSTFEMLVRKHIFILIFFLTGILINISTITLFTEEEVFCGFSNDANGILGAFLMLFIMNWKECLVIFNPLGRFLTSWILFIYTLVYEVFVYSYGKFFRHLLSVVYGALIFAVITKPIKKEKWKTIVRIMSGIIVLTASSASIVSFYLKK